MALHKSFSIISAIYYVLVNKTVKALPKKRKYQMVRNPCFITEASMLKYQALWYSTFIAMYTWFLYCVSCDFFVWHKPIAEVNLVNLAGSILSIAFIWAGTRIFKRNRTGTQRTQTLQQQQQQQPLRQKPPQKTLTNGSLCTHYLGYLNQRQKQQEIPGECLTCEKVIQCFSSAKQ